MARPSSPDPKLRAREFWTFKRAAMVLLLMSPWASLVGYLARGTISASDGRAMFAFGMFFAILPIFAVLAFLPRYIFEFFRSVRVGVVNLVLIGLASIVGVLFHQENSDFPLPEGAVASLNNWSQEGSTRPWTRDERIAYDSYAGMSGRGPSFRNAQAFFVYRFSENLGLDGLFGLDAKYDIDYKAIDDRLAPVRERLPEIEARFGTDFSIALASQSESGLITQGRNKRINAVEQKFDDFWWSLFVWSDRLDLIRVYKSDWFALYWFLLFGGVLVNTFRGGWKRLLKPNRWGFLVTHAGVLLICLGGLLSRMGEQRGLLELNVGRKSDQWKTWSQDVRQFHGESTSKGRPPFAVQLDGFRADHHDVLSVNFIQTKADGSQDYEFKLDRQPEERMWQGKVLRYDRTLSENDEIGEPQLRIEVVEKIEQSEVERKLRRAEPGQLSVPMARLAVVHHGEVLREQALTLPFPEQGFPTIKTSGYSVLVHEDSGSRTVFYPIRSRADAESLLAEPVELRHGVLRRDNADREHLFHDLNPGVSFEDETADGVYQVEVLNLLPDFRLEAVQDGNVVAAPLDKPMPFVAPRNPAALLRITAPSGEVEERWVLEADTQHTLPTKFKELRYSFHWDRWQAPAEHRYAIFVDGDDQIWWGEFGDIQSLRQVNEADEINFPVSVEGGVADQLRLLQAMPDASAEPVYLQRTGADFFDPSPAAVLLRITSPDATGEPSTEDVWMRTRDGVQSHFIEYTAANGSPRQVVLVFREQSEQLPVEWQSKLSILEQQAGSAEWQPVRTGTIRVNDYLEHSGYRFFQTNHDPRDPTYSGIGVVYDPGIEMVLTGFYMVMFGTIVVFLIKPLFTRRHRAA